LSDYIKLAYLFYIIVHLLKASWYMVENHCIRRSQILVVCATLSFLGERLTHQAVIIRLWWKYVLEPWSEEISIH